jgi:hypothetical protein
MTEPSPSDLALREFQLTDVEIKDAQDSLTGIIRILLATRDKARLEVCNEIWNFQLRPSLMIEKDGQMELMCSTTRNVRRDEMNTRYWDLIWFRAAEAMLAVRRGQMEARENTKKKKLAREAKKQSRAA